ncbi:ATP-binding protein [Planomonospora parontospora subsp. parontospora]|uniref:ATP-binding protein n=2 Tax=Planomonospora parontospora TaxID=58119 RepID=A0AA37F2I1_9ACTN|nr:ATP-binding protein [Planomonospora parontospora]GGK49474.1 ATP-binding protein [Planomonospora parontospora]GII12474.1 ATP-binding protein [Planomonospora parontospora subsp. parontospora]
MDLSEYDGELGGELGGEPGGGVCGEWVLRLAGSPEQVMRARRLVSATLGRGHPLHDDCVLLTSEIVTNAVVHSRSGRGGAFVLGISCSARGVRVSVQDEGSSSAPCVCHASAEATGGRGLPLLEALAHRWGLVRRAGSNKVWFELELEPAELPRPRLAGVR